MTAGPTAGTGRRELRAWATAELAAAGCVSAAAEADWLLDEAPDEDALRTMVARRAAGEPLQYVIGWAPFGPLKLRVGPGVFVPRPETETLADRAAAFLRTRPMPRAAVDLTVGSADCAVVALADDTTDIVLGVRPVPAPGDRVGVHRRRHRGQGAGADSAGNHHRGVSPLHDPDG